MAVHSTLLRVLLTGALAIHAADVAWYRRQGGTFTATPDASLWAPSRTSCAVLCRGSSTGFYRVLPGSTSFCRGFTYRADGTCDLYHGEEACYRIRWETLPLQVDTTEEHNSYLLGRPADTCPGNATATCACPPGFSRCAGRCLARLDTPVSYTEAASQCVALGAHLAVPRSEAENQCAIDAAVVDKHWLGVTDLLTEGAFLGDDATCGTVPVNAAWWKTGEPNNYGSMEDCVNVEGGKWNDVPCDYPYHPLCQLANCYRPDCL